MASDIDITQIISQPAYIINTRQFLDETDTRKALTYWLTEYSNPDEIESVDDITITIERAIAHIDHLINDQLNAIIHHPDFLALESSWRGLWYLVEQADGIRNIKLRVLDISWAEVSRDISRAMEFDQSLLFRKIYSEEYGTPGGEPYGVIVGDYEISHKPSARHRFDDIETLTGLSQIAAAAFSPFICAASPALFGLDDFAMLTHPLDLSSVFAQKEFIKWRQLRSRAETQFVGLMLPRILMRRPYRSTAGSYQGIYFRELTGGDNASNYCWGNAAYAFAGILIREFASVGWFGHIRGAPRNQIGGGVVSTLSCDSFTTDLEGIAHKPITDAIITDTRERELSELGFIPLSQCYDLPLATFYNNQSLRSPERMPTQDAEINARLSAMLQHVLCGARIAHYIKVIIRDKVGSFITAEECENYLRDWLFKYTTGREDMEWEEQARYPLREAVVSVRDHPQKTGDFVCVIHLRPHYQLDHMVSELELITELAQAV